MVMHPILNAPATESHLCCCSMSLGSSDGRLIGGPTTKQPDPIITQPALRKHTNFQISRWQPKNTFWYFLIILLIRWCIDAIQSHMNAPTASKWVMAMNLAVPPKLAWLKLPHKALSPWVPHKNGPSLSNVYSSTLPLQSTVAFQHIETAKQRMFVTQPV